MSTPPRDINEQWFRELFEGYRNRLYGYVKAITHSEHAAEELTQEVFIKLWLIRDQLHAVQDLDRYIFKATRNRTLNYLRKAANDERVMKELKSRMVVEENNVLEEEYRRTFERLIAGAMEKLSPQQKRVYDLSRNAQKSYDEIGEEMGISRNTVKAHMVEALKQIRGHFLKNAPGSLAVMAFLLS